MAEDPRVERLRDLHERAKLGPLSGPDRAEYERLRAEIGRLLLIAQSLSHAGHTLRSELRVAQMIKAVLDPDGDAPEKSTTIDLSSSGFALLLGSQRSIGHRADFLLRLPASGDAGAQMVRGRARVASCRAHGGLFRVSFAIDAMEPRARETLEMVLLDFVLARFSG